MNLLQRVSVIGALLGLLTAQAATPGGEAGLKNWSQWRGPLATGVAPHANPPLKWSETENVKWKVATPGFGTSTPIIWENKIFIVTAIPTGQKVEAKTPPPAPQENPPPQGQRQRRPGGGGGAPRGEQPTEAYRFTILCLDRATGKTLWQKVAREEVPHEGHHQDHGFASSSPITDGQALISSFGSRGLYCHDLDGNLKWEKDFGDMRTRNGFGEGASPALHGNTVVLPWDHEGEDFVVALDKNSGKELWRVNRDEPTGWSTPLIVEYGGKTQVILNATGKVRSYDLATGKQIWEIGGQTVNAIPTPVTDGETVYVTSGFRGSALYAIKLGKTGDLAGTDAVRWSHNRATPYVPSPLLVDNLIYFVQENRGRLSIWDTKEGKALVDAEQLQGINGIYASPVAAGDRVYVLGREGTCVVLKKGPTLEVLASNRIDDRTDASIALVGNELFIRGHKALYSIAEKR
ncbi:MAG TPA: PQQ-binding-like beta-propeller repeat protein [Methylomirabilota bacterium]|nr:PQQ-binding-like beta-propeller repeat protein [Methylomirabilota bacterium]